MFNKLVLENELSKRANRDIRFSYNVYYSPEDFSFFRKVLVDGQEFNVSIDLDSLHAAEENGTLEQKYEEILTKIKQLSTNKG